MNDEYEVTHFDCLHLSYRLAQRYQVVQPYLKLPLQLQWNPWDASSLVAAANRLFQSIDYHVLPVWSEFDAPDLSDLDEAMNCIPIRVLGVGWEYFENVDRRSLDFLIHAMAYEADDDGVYHRSVIQMFEPLDTVDLASWIAQAIEDGRITPRMRWRCLVDLCLYLSANTRNSFLDMDLETFSYSGSGSEFDWEDDFHWLHHEWLRARLMYERAMYMSSWFDASEENKTQVIAVLQTAVNELTKQENAPKPLTLIEVLGGTRRPEYEESDE